VLILTEYFMTFSESRMHVYHIICVLGSLITYVICLFFLNDYLHIASLTLEQFVFILIIFGASWAPLLFWKYISVDLAS